MNNKGTKKQGQEFTNAVELRDTLAGLGEKTSQIVAQTYNIQ